MSPNDSEAGYAQNESACEVLLAVLGYCAPGGLPTIVSPGKDEYRFLGSTEMHESIHYATFLSTGFGLLQAAIHFVTGCLASDSPMALTLRRVGAVAMDESRLAHEAIATFGQREYIATHGSESDAEEYVRRKPALYQEGCAMYLKMTDALRASPIARYPLASTLNDCVFQSSAVGLVGRLLTSSEADLTASIRQTSPNHRLRLLERALQSGDTVDRILMIVKAESQNRELGVYAASVGSPERLPCYALMKAINDTCLPMVGQAAPWALDEALLAGLNLLRKSAQNMGLESLSNFEVGLTGDRSSRIERYGRAAFVVEASPQANQVVVSNTLELNHAVHLVTRSFARARMLYIHVGTPVVSYAIPLKAEQNSEILVIGMYAGEPLEAILNQIWLRMIREEIPSFIEVLARSRAVAVVQPITREISIGPSFCNSTSGVAWYYYPGVDAVLFAKNWLRQHADGRYTVVIDPRRDSRTMFLVRKGYPSIVLPISGLGVYAVESWLQEERLQPRELDATDVALIGGIERASMVKDHLARWGF